MRKAERSCSPPAVGGATLLAVLAILCLAVFAVLCLSAVRADDRLSQSSADAVTAWYQAETQAEETLARLRSGQMPEGVEVREDTYYYCIPISETRELQVEVRLEGTEYAVLRWQASSSGVSIPDGSLPVWNGS